MQYFEIYVPQKKEIQSL